MFLLVHVHVVWLNDSRGVPVICILLFHTLRVSLFKVAANYRKDAVKWQQKKNFYSRLWHVWKGLQVIREEKMMVMFFS